MAIDRVKKVTILLPASQVDRLYPALHDLSMVHLTDASELIGTPEHLEHRFVRLEPPEHAREVDDRVRRLAQVVSALAAYDSRKRSSVMEVFVPLPMVVQIEEFEAAARGLDDQDLFDEVHGAVTRLHDARRRADELAAEILTLEPLHRLRSSMAALCGMRSFTLSAGLVTAQKAARLEETARTLPLAVETIEAWDGNRAVLVAYRPADRAAVEAVLREVAFDEIAVPDLDESPAEALSRFEEERREALEAAESAEARLRTYAEDLREIEIALAYWENIQAKVQGRSKGLASNRIAVVGGYIRARDLTAFERRLSEGVPEATCLVENPAPGEAVPVSLTLPRWLRPMTLMVRMFGLPDYHSFDPTPFLASSFLLFFGICFGDVIYGLLLIAMAFVMARRLRAHAWMADFFRLFLYGGITTAFFGAVTGSWASDLWKPEYLGEGNVLQRAKETFPVFDPMAKLVIGLLIALGIGVVNQVYGILLNMYAAVRRRDYVAAIFDGGSWLLVLPGFIILASTLFAEVPPTASTIGWGLFGAGYLMLIVSQGRQMPGVLGKVLGGMVSIYGIFGSYGCVSFIGDTLSYSRLLALGLTTSIVGMAFNIIAGLFSKVPVAGPVLFWLVVIGGHTFNFFISVLGGFVHSARLILLEFFGRFYQSGGQEFAPYGFRHERIHVVRS